MQIAKRYAPWIAFILTLVLMESVLWPGQISALAPGAPQAQPPILVSIVMHNEEPRSGRYPDFVNDEPAFWQHRAALVQFVDVLHDHGVMFNYQSDWNFLMAAGLYDNGTPETNGENIVRYIKDLGFEIDPHAHESQYNYADVAYLINVLGVAPSHTAGGFLAAPPEASKLEYLWHPITATLAPTYTWQAEILWGGATSLHQNEEALWASGVWKPQDNEHFMEHDDAAPLPHVGGYGRDCERLVQKQQDGELEEGKIHTCTIFVGQNKLLQPGFIPGFAQRIQALNAAGDVRWVGLAEVVDIWQTEYESEPNILPYLTPPPRVYLPLILKSFVTPTLTPTTTPSPTPTLTLTPTPTLSLTPTPSATYEPSAPAGYLVISYNANYLRGSPGNMQHATVQQFMPTLNRHLDLIDGLDGSATLTTGMAADYYFTGLAAEKLAEWSAQTVTRLLDSPYGLHYHGANRPPYPQLVDQVLGQDWEQDVATVRTYEADGLNPATGAHVGGIAAFRNVFGQAPFATGRFLEASILAVDKEMGAHMAVGLEDNTGASRSDAWFMGVLSRSESLALGPAPLVDAALHDQGEEYLAQVRAQLTSLTDPMPIAALLIHDHDFYKHPPADQEKIWALYEQVLELTQDLGFRSVTLHDIYALAQNGPAPTLTQDELLQAAQSLVQAIEATGYPPEYVEVGQVANLSYSLAEAFEGLALALTAHRETGSLPASVEAHDLLGPTVVFHSNVTMATVPADDVLDAAAAISAAITDRLPSQVGVGSQTINPAEFLYLMAQEYVAIAQGAPSPVTLRSVYALPLAVIQNHKADSLTKLQFWTYKPAVFADGRRK